MGPEVLYGRNHRLIVPSLKPHHSLTYSLTRTEDRTGQNEGFVNFSHLKGAPPITPEDHKTERNTHRNRGPPSPAYRTTLGICTLSKKIKMTLLQPPPTQQIVKEREKVDKDKKNEVCAAGTLSRAQSPPA
jgi:hypothetical protein